MLWTSEVRSEVRTNFWNPLFVESTEQRAAQAVVSLGRGVQSEPPELPRRTSRTQMLNHWFISAMVKLPLRRSSFMGGSSLPCQGHFWTSMAPQPPPPRFSRSKAVCRASSCFAEGSKTRSAANRRRLEPAASEDFKYFAASARKLSRPTFGNLRA